MGQLKRPADQAENETDRQISANVRQAVVGDSSLSTNAHNVKIITSGGTVTLRGPVKSTRGEGGDRNESQTSRRCHTSGEPLGDRSKSVNDPERVVTDPRHDDRHFEPLVNWLLSGLLLSCPLDASVRQGAVLGAVK